MLVRKVLSTRRATGFHTEANNWKGPCAAVGGGEVVLPRSGDMLCWKILKFYICRDLFSCILKFETISFNCQKKITFLHNLIMIWIPALR